MLTVIIKETLLPVSGQPWEEQDRFLLDRMGCPTDGREGTSSLRQNLKGGENHQNRRLTILSIYHAVPKEDTRRMSQDLTHGRHSMDIYSVGDLNS